MKEPRERSEVILCGTCFADVTSAISIAVRMADEIGGDLRAVLMEDQSVIEYAQLPIARAVLQSGKESLSVTSDAMREAFQEDARRIEFTLQQTSRQYSLMCRFEQLTGQMGSMTEQLVEAGDVLMFAHQTFGLQRGATLVIEDLHRFDESVRNLAEAVARLTNTRIEFVLLDTSGDASGKEGAGAKPESMRLPPGTIVAKSHEGLLDILNRRNPASILANLQIISQLGIERLLLTARCPILVPIT